jgi:predicted nucleic acid-binding protein
MREVPEYVLDASIAVKWHLHDEEFVAEARIVLADFREGRIRLLAPDHIRYEVASAIRQAVRRGRLQREVGAVAIDQFLAWNVTTIGSSDLIRSAYDQALRHGCSLYDGLYLALAEAARCPLLYADERLRHNLTHRFPYALWIGEYSVNA